MKPRHTRLVRYVVFILILGSGAFLVLWSMWGELSFYQTPTQVIQRMQANTRANIQPGNIRPDIRRDIRLGGYVKKGSISATSKALKFRVYDAQNEILVVYQGIVSTLFQEEQGVVLDGYMLPNGTFRATRVLAKHDEVYTSKKRTLGAPHKKTTPVP